jgi:hypothetical protein
MRVRLGRCADQPLAYVYGQSGFFSSCTRLRENARIASRCSSGGFVKSSCGRTRTTPPFFFEDDGGVFRFDDFFGLWVMDAHARDLAV